MSLEFIKEVTSTLQPLATVLEVARALRVSTRTLKRYVASGRMACVRADAGSSKLLIPRAEVERFLRALAQP